MADVQERLIDRSLLPSSSAAQTPSLASGLNATMTSGNPAAKGLYLYRAAEVLGQHCSLVVPLELALAIDHAD